MHKKMYNFYKNIRYCTLSEMGYFISRFECGNKLVELYSGSVVLI